MTQGGGIASALGKGKGDKTMYEELTVKTKKAHADLRVAQREILAALAAAGWYAVERHFQVGLPADVYVG